MTNKPIFYTGIGKRKTSVAKVYLTEGSGKININSKTIDTFFKSFDEESNILKNPFILVNLINKYDVIVKVHGGGFSSQLDAILLAIARAICSIDYNYKSALNQNLFLRRDARIKERRKYGLKKARKAPQYSKR